MNTIEKLTWLIQNCCSVSVEANENRTFYRSIAEELAAHEDPEGVYADMEPEVRAECIARDQLVIVQVYPDTPVGFYCVHHYDVAVAINRVFEAVQKERRTP